MNQPTDLMRTDSFFPASWQIRYAVYLIGLVSAIAISLISGVGAALAGFCYVTLSAFRGTTAAAFPRTILLNVVLIGTVIVLVLLGQEHAAFISFVSSTAVAIRMPKR